MMTDLAERTARLVALANTLVDGGRFVPGLSVDDKGRGRSWWWPLPAATHRPVLLALLADDDAAAHSRLADELAALVDSEVRARLLRSNTSLAPRRPGRRTVPQSWLHALASEDPWLPSTLDPDRVRALERTVAEWVRSGVPAAGRVRLCLRIVAPDLDAEPELFERPSDPDVWAVELLAQDTEESSLTVSTAELWNGSAPLGEGAIEDILRALGHLDRLAPELADLLDQADPVWAEIDASVAVEMLRNRMGLLTDAGIGVLLPSWWTHRKQLGVRMKAKSSASQSSAKSAGLGMEALVNFRWEAALGDERLTKREISQLRKAAMAKHSVVRFRGAWVEITPETFAALDQLVGTSGEATAAQVLRASLGFGDDLVPEGIDVTEVVATGWLGELLDNALHATVEPIPTPATFVGALRPYQERGVGWLGFLGRLGLGGCLADDMGLGKTAQVIAALLDDVVDGPTLVVCPVSVLGNWQAELARFAPHLSVLVHHGPTRLSAHDEPFAERAAAHDVVLTTYSLVPRDESDLTAVAWGRFVLDEAQNVKNPAAKVTKATAQLRADRRVALTGTPVENTLSELWSIMHLLNPGLLGSARSFRQRYVLPIEVDRDEAATDKLLRMTGPFVLRRLKSDKSIITDLPDKIETTDHCPLTREQASLYQAVVDDLLRQSEESDGIKRRGIVLAGLMKLKQVCNHPAHFLGDGSSLARRSGKLIRVEELVDELLEAGDKALFFTQFRAWGDALQPYLAERFGVDVLWLHGGVRRPKRDAMVAQFGDPAGPPLFLISVKAGGTGLNLTDASHVIHLDRWWNPAVEDQATDRAYRIGQKRNVFVHKLVSTGTVEEKIDALITSKRELADRVLGTGEDWLTELSTNDLRDLVSLQPSALQAENEAAGVV